MTTGTKANNKKAKAVEPIDIDAALAKLILLRREKGLPRPTGYESHYGDKNFQTHRITVRVATLADLILWADALDIPKNHNRSSHFYENGSEIHTADASSWHGWWLTLRASIDPADTHRPCGLDDATVDALKEVAAPAEPAPIVSDETIAEAELAPEKLAMHIQAVSA